MEQSQLTCIVNFIWKIADDVLRDFYVRGKYRDVILPITVLRRLDTVLEPTKQAGLFVWSRLVHHHPHTFITNTSIRVQGVTDFA
nr:type I restriction-modification system subunit M N-terminal domain-containing protein [Alicyclobacillus macrosporangiidus]